MGPINGGPMNFSFTRLRHASLRFATLTRANLEMADLSEADLSDARLDGANLSGADLCGALCERADFADARLGGANLAAANLKDARNLTQAQIDELYAWADRVRLRQTVLELVLEGLALQDYPADRFEIIVVGSGLYIGAGLGPGPRDGLMVGLAAVFVDRTTVALPPLRAVSVQSMRVVVDLPAPFGPRKP